MRLPSAPRVVREPAIAATIVLACALASIALLAARGDLEPVRVRFVAGVGGEPFSCALSLRAADGRRVTPQDLRLFVHGVVLLDERGRVHPVTLIADGVSQSEEVALLDFEDGTGSCGNGTRLVHTTLEGRAPARRWTGLRFVLGVPFALNHADPTRAAPPLNLGRMHWGWQAGYKFLRFEGVREDGEAVRFHLGSTGCRGTFGRIEGCARENRAVIELSPFDPAQDVVTLDLEALLDVRCMSDAGDAGCRAPFAAAGLSPDGEAQAVPRRLFGAAPA